MIKNENIAERIFCDLRNAEFKIAKPSYQIDGHKIGDGPKTIQICLWEGQDAFGFGFGPALDFSKPLKSFTEAYNLMLSEIKNIGKELKFYSLVVPRRACVEARLEEFEKVVTRYIVDYLPQSDQVVARWDVLVGSASD